MITLRLDPALAQQMNFTAQHLGITRSEFIRKIIVSYIQNQKSKSARETGQGLLGKYSIGKNNLSTDLKEILKDRVRTKRGYK